MLSTSRSQPFKINPNNWFRRSSHSHSLLPYGGPLLLVRLVELLQVLLKVPGQFHDLSEMLIRQLDLVILISLVRILGERYRCLEG